MPPITLADIVFSEQANHQFSRILGDLKKSNLSIPNRLASILQDAAFVASVADGLRLPVVANERCGSWYVDPERKAASAYFKSTDGHAGQWQFSTRRLNLHLLELIGKHNGCIIVDSTRRGKRIPDALSKTVPIWCCIMNAILFPDDTACHGLYSPPSAVSDSEKSQIEARLGGYLKSFMELGLDITPLRQHVAKPLRPVWVTQDGSPLPPVSEAFASFHPVVCCTSSRRVAGTEMSEGGYIQGAGDDTEAWAHGLTAPVFWSNKETLLSAPEANLPSLIEFLMANAVQDNSGAENITEVTSHIAVGVLPMELSALGSRSCLVSLLPKVTPRDTWKKSARQMEAGIGKGKTGSRLLREALPQICQFASEFLAAAMVTPIQDEPRIVIACETGKDLSVGLALALDCWLFNSDDTLRPRDQRLNFDKACIRVRLGHIMQAVPESNPTRTTLQSVNSFLMDWRK